MSLQSCGQVHIMKVSELEVGEEAGGKNDLLKEASFENATATYHDVMCAN